jgi:hypothetical protein
MSKEMLPEKLSRDQSNDQSLGPESLPIVIENNEGKRERSLVVFLVALGIGILVLTTIVLLPYVNSFGGNIFGSVSSNSTATTTTTTTTTTDRGDSVAKPTTALPASFKAIAGNGNVIEENGVTKSDWITITGYSDSQYDPSLQCSIDSLHIYCSDSREIGLSDLPIGKHTFTVVEPSNGETIVRAFSRKIIPS